MPSFSSRLAQAVIEKKTPALVGLDPRLASLPAPLQPPIGSDVTVIAAAYETFCNGIVDVVAPLVPAVKPQAAFFEQLGPAGTTALGNVISYARNAGLIVLLDGKRGDIGSTAEAYADAYLGHDSPWGADALTVNPYLGGDTLEPFVKACDRREAGIFVLVKTSNPGSGDLQDLVVEHRSVYQRVAAIVEELSAARVGDRANVDADNATAGDVYGPVGAVVGATYPEQLSEMREAMPHCWLLVPGFGAQGGSAADVAGAFHGNGLGALVNSSRAIIFAHQRPPYEERFGAKNWQRAVESAAQDMVAALSDATAAGSL